MTAFDFQNLENWHGGPTYDLAMAWPAGEDRQLLDALMGVDRSRDLPIDFEGFNIVGRDQGILAEVQRCGLGCLLPNTAAWQAETPHWLERPSGLRWLPPREN